MRWEIQAGGSFHGQRVPGKKNQQDSNRASIFIFFFLLLSFLRNQGIELVTRTRSYQMIQDRNSLHKVEHEMGSGRGHLRPQASAIGAPVARMAQCEDGVGRESRGGCGFGGKVGRAPIPRLPYRSSRRHDKGLSLGDLGPVVSYSECG